MHFCLLLGYGAGAVNPYLAYETLRDMVAEQRAARRRCGRGGEELQQGRRQGPPQGHVQDGHLDAPELPRRADLRGDRAQPRGDRPLLHLDRVAHRGHRARRHRAEAQERHDHAYKVSPALDGDLEVGGQYQWRRRGEYHMYNPNTIAKLQHAVRAGSYKMFKEYTALANDESRRLCTLRGLLRFKSGHADPARRGRAGLARSSSASRPARCRSARSAARRTRTSPSR